MPLLTLIQQRTKESMAQHPLYPPSLPPPPKKLELQSAPPRPGLLQFFQLVSKSLKFLNLIFQGPQLYVNVMFSYRKKRMCGGAQNFPSLSCNLSADWNLGFVECGNSGMQFHLSYMIQTVFVLFPYFCLLLNKTLRCYI